MKRKLIGTMALAVLTLAVMSFATTKYSADKNKETSGKFIEKDAKKDNLLSAENCVLVVIDYQQEMLGSVYSIDQELLTNNMKGMVKTANNFNVPIILSTVAVDMGYNKPTIPEVGDLMKDVKSIDRTTLNGWQDQEFIDAIKATGRKKILMTGLWTAGCPAYTTVDAIEAGYEVYAVSDAMGDGTLDAHNRAMDRMVQAGAIPMTWESAMAEILRDYNNPNVGGAVQIMKDHFYPVLGKN